MQPIRAALTIQPILTENGYTVINMGTTDIIQDTNTILHIINTWELKQTIDAIEENINRLEIRNDPLIAKELEDILAKLKAIEPNPRHKRELINIIGTTNKWLFGTMHDDDRKEILDHIDILEKNQEKAINNMNKQIEINSHINETINSLKNIIEADRNQITKTYEEVTANERKIILQQIKLDQIFRLQTLKEKDFQIITNHTVMNFVVTQKHPSSSE
ncbi:unnamed protein product [Hermetia illucens]|uniref:Uncharacterized protein n=1 Tax=Hermetia illucens TaxID=343691 RepID=A0A7R8YLW7_HERIL|nr:unnamed protein product [Hermetia illucens]